MLHDRRLQIGHNKLASNIKNLPVPNVDSFSIILAHSIRTYGALTKELAVAYLPYLALPTYMLWMLYRWTVLRGELQQRETSWKLAS